MKYVLEVLADDAINLPLPHSPSVEGKIVLVLSEDGKSVFPSGIQLPGMEDLPNLALVKVTKAQ